MNRPQKSIRILRKAKNSKDFAVNRTFAILTLQLYVKNNFSRERIYPTSVKPLGTCC